ncbi:hypothetical protein LCGC14_2543750 [marine sediment metagenome]|uniref:Uncharacterized protein n=1 Tax=marine sediment metagenome TaxID=412755 RepID=A0A0F9APX2_9ZZZZ
MSHATRQTLPLIEVTSHGDAERRWSCQNCDWIGAAIDAGLADGDYVHHCPTCQQPRSPARQGPTTTAEQIGIIQEAANAAVLRAIAADAGIHAAILRAIAADTGIPADVLAAASPGEGAITRAQQDPACQQPPDDDDDRPVVRIVDDALANWPRLRPTVSSVLEIPINATRIMVDQDCRQYVVVMVPPIWVTVIDEHTCDHCCARDGAECTLHWPPHRECTNPDGCRCTVMTREQHEISPAEARKLHARGLNSESSGESIRTALLEIRAQLEADCAEMIATVKQDEARGAVQYPDWPPTNRSVDTRSAGERANLEARDYPELADTIDDP